MYYNHSGKPDGIGSSLPNGTYALPFPGPILQVARVWLIASITMDILSGLIIWISCIKTHTKFILGSDNIVIGLMIVKCPKIKRQKTFFYPAKVAYIWIVSVIMQVLADLIFVSVFGRMVGGTSFNQYWNENVDEEWTVGIDMILSMASSIILTGTLVNFCL